MEREQVVQHMTSVTFEPGVKILEQGHAGNEMYVIEEGKVEVSVSDGGSKLKRVAVLSEGDHFGEQALMVCFFDLALLVPLMISMKLNPQNWRISVG